MNNITVYMREDDANNTKFLYELAILKAIEGHDIKFICGKDNFDITRDKLKAFTNVDVHSISFLHAYGSNNNTIVIIDGIHKEDISTLKNIIGDGFSELYIMTDHQTFGFNNKCKEQMLHDKVVNLSNRIRHFNEALQELRE